MFKELCDDSGRSRDLEVHFAMDGKNWFYVGRDESWTQTAMGGWRKACRR